MGTGIEKQVALADSKTQTKPAPTTGKSVALPAVGIPIALDSGPCDGNGDSAALFLAEELTVPGWRSMRIYFEDAELGRRSFVRLTSLKDGDVQLLDRRAMYDWHGTSAYFNGDSVLLELVVDPGDRSVFVSVAGVAGNGEPIPPPPFPPPRDLCGNDDRVHSIDSRVCRIALQTVNPAEPLAWCTGWQVSNGAVLTAGHCVDLDPDGIGPMLPDGAVEANFLSGVVQFNVPLSDCDGAPNHPPAADQYPISAVSAYSYPGVGLGIGRDWAVFSIRPNGVDVAHITRGFFRMTSELPDAGATARITGFGTDVTPAGCGPPVNPANDANQTNQTSWGEFLSETASANAIRLQYAVDSTGGNSGSPVIWDGQNITFGIHTNGGCTADGGANIGTSFELDPLENAVADFPGGNARYVDAAFPINVTRNGTIFRPWNNVLDGRNSVPTGGHLCIVAGSYNQTMVFDRPMIIRAPVGTVVIGH